MRGSAFWSTLLVVMLLAAVPACLPAGEPPAGRQLWAGRDRTLAGILPARSPDDGVVRVLVSRPRANLVEGSDLFLISAGPSGAISDQPLVERWTCPGVMACIEVDDHGRVFAWSAPAEQQPDLFLPPLLSRIDVDSGQRIDFGAVSDLAFSARHGRAAVALAPTSETRDTVVVLEADGGSVELSQAIDPTFLGEDLYFVDQDHVLQRLPAAGPREVVRAGVTSVEMATTSGAPRLFLRLPSPGMSRLGPVVLFNPVTGEEWGPLPSDGFRGQWVSSDGQWVLGRVDSASRRKFALFELATGTAEPFELPSDASDPVWRPNHVEVWFQAITNQPDRPIFIKKPQQPLRELAGTVQPTVVPDGSYSRSTFFTKDGAHVFSVEFDDGFTTARLFVGDADDPAGARFPLNPRGTRYLKFSELSDGRLVSESFYRGPDRNDIYLVDPSDGATRLLARDGLVMAVGASRVAAVTHRIDQRGDLEVIELESGQATSLAKEFVTSCYVQARPDDPDLARPEAPVVFQFRARFASPHDGYWLTTLP